MGKRTSNPTSACAPFCTPEEIEKVTQNINFPLARRLRSAYANKLFVLPPLMGDHRHNGNGDDSPLFLGSEVGLPIVRIKSSYDGEKFTVAPTRDHVFLQSTNCVTTPNLNYAVVRTKKTVGTIEARIDINRLIKHRLFAVLKHWLANIIDREAVATGTTITLSSDEQQWLIRSFFDANIRSTMPASVLSVIKETHDKITRTDQFTHNAYDLAALMFARHKWIAIDMGVYCIVAAVETSDLCQIAQDAVSANKSPNSLYYSEFDNKFNLSYSVPPTVIRSVDNMENPQVRSLMSSLAYMKGTISMIPGLASQELHNGLLALPYFYQASNSGWTVNLDAGWVYLCDFNKNDSASRGYGQFVFMDKD